MAVLTPSIPSVFALFNNWNFNNVPNLQVYATKPHKLGNRKLNIFQAARRSYRKTSSAYYASRQIDLGVYITAPTRTALDQALDTLWANIQSIEGTLVIPQSGGVRQYFCTFGTVFINQEKGGFIDMTLTFECSDNFGYDTNYTVIQPATNYTAAVVSGQYTQGGGADTQVPIFQVKIGAITGPTGTITYGNLNTGQAITVSSRTWSVNDVLIIDSQNKTVQVNGVDVAFTGAFPEFGLGTQTWTYQDTFTTRTVNIFDYVYNRWN